MRRRAGRRRKVGRRKPSGDLVSAPRPMPAQIAARLPALAQTEARILLVASAPVEHLSFGAKHLPDRATSHGTRIDRPRGPATYGCNEQMFGAK